jgi:hypothetical protein
MENVIMVDRDEKDDTVAPLKLYFVLLGFPSCQSAVRKTVLNEGQNELELKKPGQVCNKSNAGSSKMFLFSYAFFIVPIFIDCRCRYVVSNKLNYFRGNHSGDSMHIRVKGYF